MELAFFPISYPSELLYYTVCRYNKMMKESATTTNRRLFNKAEIGLKPFYMDNYPLFSDLLIKSKEHILEEHTPYRYFAPFCRKDDVDRLKRTCFDNDSRSHFNFLSNDLDYKNIRYCPVCAKMEQEAYGEPYISTFHCLPNVPFCIYHGCQLIPIAPEKYQWRLEYLIICNIQDEGYRPIELIPIMDRISPLIEELFSDPYQPFKYRIQDFPERMYTLLLKNGYIYQKGECLNYIKLKNDLFEQYNLNLPNVLKILDLKEDDFKSISLILSRSTRNRLKPIIYYMVIGLFCKSMNEFYETKPYNFKSKTSTGINIPLDEEEMIKRIKEANRKKDINFYNEIRLSYKKICKNYEIKPMITKQILLSHTENFKSCFKLDNLPRSKALIDSLIDNPDDYKYEQIRSAALILINEGRKVSGYNLKKIAHLSLSESTIKKLWPRVMEEYFEHTYKKYRSKG